ncbi:MAG: hypothetical protein IJH45_05615 [Firmicutes bacterium]|nr:hypothetical protein [Bacillota bacterium]
MFFALDENNVRVNAADGEFKNCICPACGSPVIQKRGDTNRHHFAHDPRKRNDVKCPYDYNADYKNMSEWHIRMQEYFPKEEREYIFTDKETGEKHIADVYIKETNTVLEFQHSSLKKKEFLDRTMFHLNEGRRIAWLFDESWKDANEESYNNEYCNGKLVKEKNWRAEGPYKSKSFRWRYMRKFVVEGPLVYQPNYSVCLYTGAEGDVFHRIISLNGNSIIVSLHDVAMSNELNVEELFVLESFWQEQEPWKSELEAIGGQNPFSKYNSSKYNSPQKPDAIEIEFEPYPQSKKYIAEHEYKENEANWESRLEYYDDLDKRLRKK